MSHIVFLLEEPSAEEFLKQIMPRLLPGIDFRIITFEGKQDLEKNVERKIRSYRIPNTSFIILRDQDSGDCSEIKSVLKEKCEKAGKPDTFIRIACRELESWYLADLKSVGEALGIDGLEDLQKKKKFRNPDLLENPSIELKKLTKNKYQKISGSRAIGGHINLNISSSNSFRVFIELLSRFIVD